MNCVIPYTKEITFKNKIAEITSISLEHEMSVNETELLGNFIVSGEYKSHELSVNKEEFSYTLPFSIDVTDKIDLDTIDFSITDFSYETVGDNTLKVFIEFSVVASEKEVEEEREEVEETIFEDASKVFESDVKLPEVILEDEEGESDDTVTDIEDRIDLNDAETILDSIKNDNEEYALYHIHIVKETETIEAISAMYNTSIDLITEYNDLSNVGVGDKLIIPEDKDE